MVVLSEAVGTNQEIGRSFGSSVRCFKNEVIPTIDPTSIQLTTEITAPNQKVRVNQYFQSNHTIDR
ncbi:MAG: hypothetical protein LBI53_00940 [Candidatus Peribacteria bacterium]|jgi:hypothetical protein|nr:hypothetical protein [Candidatus Peribacteria bacterium]